ncbi:MAG: DUF2089 domain-containing protein [Bacillota bacterium]|jgi:hypothetical protein
MRNPMIGKCPVCSGELEVTKLRCPNCNTSLEGRFEICRFCQLSSEQKEFVEIFLKSRGNIREVEREMGISYPTVRSRLDEVLRTLGFTVEADESAGFKAERRREILEALSSGKISSDEAIKMLKSQ